MSDLDVSLRLRLINLMAGGAREAISDLRRVQQEAEKVNKPADGGGRMRASDWAEQTAAIERQKLRLAEAQKAVDLYFSNIERKLAHLGMASMGFTELERIGEKMGKPIDDATASAIEFEKRIQSIAKAGGLLGKEGGIGDSILRAAREGNIAWQELARGERQMVALGGGDYLEKIASVRGGLAKLIKASEADAGDLYNLMYHYMHLGKMTPQQALSAAEVNYQQGKKGAFELKDLAEVMPRLIPLGQEYMSNKQVATDLVALLQILRKQTGSASEAETRARHAMTKLSDPNEAKRIEKELGLDIYKIREDARAKGENQLFAVLDAIAEKFKAMGDAAGKVKESPEGPDHEGAVEGGDPKKLGGIARDYYFRAALEAYMKMRGELKEYEPSAEEAHKATLEDFAATAQTAAAALERFRIASDEAAIRAGNTQLGLAKWGADQKTKAAGALGSLAENAPGPTGAAMIAWDAIAKVGAAIGNLGNTAIGGATSLLALQYTFGRIAQWLSKGAKGAAEAAPEVAPKAAAAGAEAGAVAAAGGRTILGMSPEAFGMLIGRGLLFGGGALSIATTPDVLRAQDLPKLTPEQLKKSHEDLERMQGGAGPGLVSSAGQAIQDFFNWLKGRAAAPQAPDHPDAKAQPDVGKALTEAAQKGAADVDLTSAGQAMMKKFAGSMQASEGEVVAAGTRIGKAIGEAVRAGASEVDMSSAAVAMMAKYAGAIPGAEGPAIAAVKAFVAKLKAMLDFTAQPTIKPNLVTPGAAPGPSASLGPKHKQAKRGDVYIHTAHFHGVNDPKKLHEQVMARANRDAYTTNNASLHDIDTGGVG